MRLRRHLLLMLLAACAVAGFAPTAASAASPEIGRCRHLEGEVVGRRTVYNGKYKNRKCTKPSSTETGKYEWYPGAEPEEKGFKTTSTHPAVSILSAGKEGHRQGLVCTASEMAGEYTGTATETLTITLSGCLEESSRRACQNQSTEEHWGTVVSLPLEGHLGYISGAGTSKPQIGWEYKPQTGPYLFVVECEPGHTRKVLIEGSFIGRIHTKVNKMVEEYFLRYEGAFGKQLPEMFEGGSAANLTGTFLEPQEGRDITEPLAYTIVGQEEQSPEEEFEIRTP